MITVTVTGDESVIVCSLLILLDHDCLHVVKLLIILLMVVIDDQHYKNDFLLLLLKENCFHIEIK